MSEILARQGESRRCRPRTSFPRDDGGEQARSEPARRPVRHWLIAAIFITISVLWPDIAFAETEPSASKNEHPFDIGIIIDNRPLPRNEAARAALEADVDDLFEMLDRQMFIEHIMIFERPTIKVICDTFGCPEDVEPISFFAPLIWRITRENETRIVVYYLGKGRIEGLERQLLFKRFDKSPRGEVVPLSVDWLHAMLENAMPAKAVLMMDASFVARRLPCADEDLRRIDDALARARADYQQISQDRWNGTSNIELSTTTPVHPPDCDRADPLFDEIGPPSFTELVLRGIVQGEADDDQDHLIDLGELSTYLDGHMKRAARFHWGRRQNLRAVGNASQALAAVDGRRLGERNQAVLTRRHRPAKPEEKPEDPTPTEVKDEAKGGAATPNLTAGTEPNIQTKADRPIVTSVAPETSVVSKTGVTSQTGATPVPVTGGTLVPETTFITETTLVTEPSPSLASGTPNVRDGEAEEHGTVCRWVAEHMAPFVSTLVTRIKGDAAPSCAWATDPAEPELGPVAEILTPIAWRLGRTVAQDSVVCLLDCDRLMATTDHKATDQPASAPSPRRQPKRPAPVDPRTLDAHHRLACDRLHEPLPPYIGLPRWMPGPLIVSEGLRAYHGCPPLPAEPELPVPLAIAIASPDDHGTPPSTPTPMLGESPAVADADDQLADWPPSAADIDLPPETTASSATTAPSVTTAPSATTAPIIDGDLEDEDRPDEMVFVATASRVRRLQSALTVDNRNPGPIDGIMGEQTMQAVLSWREDNERANRKGALTEDEYRAIIQAFAQRFEQVLEKAPSF